MENPMTLHLDPSLFKDILNAASRSKQEGGIGIESSFIEKDYWITRSLKLLTSYDKDRRAIFKGGSSLSKIYKIGYRFSEDIDIAIREATSMSDNQIKKVITRTMHAMSEGLDEVLLPHKTKKSSQYRKQYFSYETSSMNDTDTAVDIGRILIEISSFANPYPYEIKPVTSFIYDFLARENAMDIVQQYGLDPFEIPVLDKRRTLTEKMVSLCRFSLSDDFRNNLKAKIRHFYDLYYLLEDNGITNYVGSDEFYKDFNTLFHEDQVRFDYPKGWQDRTLQDSPLLKDFPAIWDLLSTTYEHELQSLAYRAIPEARNVSNSVGDLFDIIKQHY